MLAGEIKALLAKNALTHRWVVQQMALRGIELTRSELSTYLNCNRKGERVMEILESVLAMLKEYEAKIIVE
jgi:hypothetical protein